jgi:hypothetical protein
MHPVPGRPTWPPESGKIKTINTYLKSTANTGD